MPGLKQTPTEKRSAAGSLNLFFGALLGANLGTVANLNLAGYVRLVVLLAGAVMALQIAFASKRRVYAVVTLLIYVVLLGIVYLFLPNYSGLKPDDFAKVLATLAIWAMMTLFVELIPERPDPPLIRQANSRS